MVEFTMIVTDLDLTEWEEDVQEVALFTISVEEGERLKADASAGPIPVTLVYAFASTSYAVDCSAMHSLAWLYAVCSTLWLHFFLLWLCNNGKWNSQHAWLSHKVMILIPCFKLLAAYASFALYTNCPSERVSAGLMHLVQNQFRSLYETALMCLLILLSKGLFVTRSDFSRVEFNQLSVFASMIYVTVSAYNTMGGQADITIVGMYVFMWLYCGYNSVATARQIRITASLVARTQVSDMISAFTVKKRVFRSFTLAFLLLFLFEAGIHLSTFISSQATEDGYIRPYSSLHEAVELLLVTWIFFIYRARPQSRYFTLLNDGQTLPRFSPVYRTSLFLSGSISEEWQAEIPVLILNPGGLWEPAYPFERVTLANVEQPAAGHRLKSPAQQSSIVEMVRLA